VGRPFVEDFAIERYRKGGSTYYFTQGLGATAASTLSLTALRLYGCPFYVPVTQKFDAIAINVTATGALNAYLGVYADLGSIAPGRLVRDAGAVDITITGVKIIDLTANPIVLDGGQLYWLAICPNGNPTIRATSAGTHLTCFFGLSNSLGTAWSTFCYASGSTPLPDPFPTPITIATGLMPGIFLRKV